MYSIGTLKDELKRDEGVRQFPYTDSVGKLTIGVGWNLTDNGIPENVIDALLDLGIAQAARDVAAIYPEWESLTDNRQRVLLNMAFNMGRARLAGFVNMFRNLRDMDYEKAAEEMMDSRWSRQVGPRAQRLQLMMKEG